MRYIGYIFKGGFMEYRILGRTGLKVSIMGIGGGGPTQMGKRRVSIRRA